MTDRTEESQLPASTPIVVGGKEYLTLEQVAGKFNLSAATIRYYVYTKKKLIPSQKIGNFLYFSKASVAAFEDWYTKNLVTVASVAKQLSQSYPDRDRTLVQWENWLRGRIYSKKSIPKPTSKNFWKAVKSQLDEESYLFQPVPQSVQPNEEKTK